jgi:hypothetical protein
LEIKRVMEGLTVVTVGSILLANTTGYLSWGVWWDILSLWPLLIVAVGFDILGKSLGSDLLRALSSLLVIGGLLFGALLLPDTDTRGMFSVVRSGEEQDDLDYEYSHDRHVEDGVASIRLGAGELMVYEGDELATMIGSTPFDDPVFDVRVDDSSAQVDIDGGSGAAVGVGAHMEVTLDREVEWEIAMEAGAGRIEADLSDLVVKDVRVDAGAADVELTVGDLARRTRVEVEAGVGRVVVRVPEGLEAEVRASTGLAGVDVDDAFRRVDDGEGQRTWRTPGFEDAARTISIVVEAGVAGVDIVVY